MPTHPRRDQNGARYRALRARVLAEEDHCHICGRPVDKTLRTPHPLSPEVDHIEPFATGGHPTDRANCALSHRICNQRKGDGRRHGNTQRERVTTTRRWWLEGLGSPK
jgi:5-methylcytosine-specific restriction endonuclease McrA